MAYTIWTDKDLEKYRKYFSNIAYEKLGVLNISGVYSKKDLSRALTAVGYVYRIYDRNYGCPDRAQVTNPGSTQDPDGGCRGVVVAVAKDSKTGSFIQVNDASIVHPSVVWIRRHYTGNVRLIAEHVVSDHERLLHENYCTLLEGRRVDSVLTQEHIDRFVLPVALQSLQKELAAENAKWMAQRRKTLDSAAEYMEEYLKNLKK